MALNPGLAVKAVQSALKPSFRALLKQEIANAALPAATTGLFYGMQYFDPKDPVGSGLKIAGLVGTDVAGSALLSAGIKRFGPTTITRNINPAYADDLDQLGLKPGSSLNEIAAAKRTRLGTIKNSDIADDLKKAQGEQVISSADRLKSMRPEQYFSDTAQPSGMSEFLGNLANYGFSYMGMNNLVVQPLEKAGVLVPTMYQQPMEPNTNQGLVSQADIIQQQIQDRYQRGVVNSAIVAPQTMSQLTSLEIERLLNELPVQAAEERQDLAVA
jgi:hypothetical protein